MGRSFENGRPSPERFLAGDPSEYKALWSKSSDVVIMGADDGQVLREAELFRLEESGWRLVHRHADWLHPKGAAAVIR